uniref:Raptor_N domain-containing protein n=1 Tax=Heterorhabditis bacteriophora TaxID=37862 RepID=A0A1I7XFF3_HETBA
MYSTSIMSGFHYNLSAAKAPESAPRPAPSRGKDADANRLVVQEVTLLQMEYSLYQRGFIFTQDSDPSYTAKKAVEYLTKETPGFITLIHWPLNSLDSNPCDCRLRAGRNPEFILKVASSPLMISRGVTEVCDELAVEMCKKWCLKFKGRVQTAVVTKDSMSNCDTTKSEIGTIK